MQKLLDRLNDLFEQVPTAVRPYRWLISLVFVGISILMATGINKHFTINMAPESWYPKGADTIVIRDAYRRLFGSDDNVYIVYQPKSGDVFSEQALRDIAELHQDLEDASLQAEPNELSRIVKIDSLYNARYQISDGDTLISKKLIGADFPNSAEEREQRRAIAITQDSFSRMFFSNDFRYGGISLKTNIGAVAKQTQITDNAQSTDLLQEDAFGFGLEIDSPLEVEASAETNDVEFVGVQLDEYMHFVAALREVIDQDKYSNFDFYLVGNAVTMEFIMNGVFEAAGLILMMVLLIVILLWALFRSLSAVLWSLLVVIFAGFWAIGAGAWLGVSYTTMMTLTVMLVLAVGIASCVHILSAYTLFCRQGADHQYAMTKAYRKTGLPILLTSLTTAVGMLSLTLTDMPVIQVFGATSAMAVIFSFILIFTLLPCALDLWHPKLRGSQQTKQQGKKPLIDLQPLMIWIGDFTERRSKTIVISYLVIFIVMCIGAINLKIDSNSAMMAREDTPLRQSLKIVDEEMMGGMSLEVLTRFGSADALKDPRVLKAADELQQHIAANYADKVIKTFSLANVVKDTNSVLNNNDEQYRVIPDDPRLTAQLLYMFNNANPTDRRETVNDDYSSSHISIMLRNGGTYEYTAFFKELKQDMVRIYEPLRADYPNMRIELTGTFNLAVELMDHIAWTQLKSFSFVLIIITVLMIISLGSPQAGAISMIPNILPGIVTFGLMGWLGIPLDGDTLIVAPIIIGIAVDDTIHFLTHYRASWIEHGDVGIAVRQTLSEVGQAVAFTSLVLGLGFAILIFASYLGLAKPGLFGSLAILVALLSDLLFLPALMHWLKPNMGRDKVLKLANEQAATS
ncbi:MMPL family transporter [Zhongshania sp.]|uniref:efflux RND transporter permease subunit n=1 Tax=Zhongshania sp. TaxID=1971902 RepID=UPI001B47D332|nr:MMPL family transporter [Zhongshania sp.]MBQ0796905.1 MMPL family transporter [Zhongshania sp.]